MSTEQPKEVPTHVARMRYVAGRLRDFGEQRIDIVETIAKEGENDGISGALMIALGLRETGLRPILNPAGTDKGWLQISDVYHSKWLASVSGCPSGSWTPEPGKTALVKGYVPGLEDSTRYAIRMLHGAIHAAAKAHVPEDERVRFAIASYNAGTGGAIRGWRDGDVDKYTTGRDYSADVLKRRSEVNGSAIYKKWRSEANG